MREAYREDQYDVMIHEVTILFMDESLVDNAAPDYSANPYLFESSFHLNSYPQL